MGYLSSRDRYVKDLPIKLGPNPPHVCVPPKRNPPFKVRRRRVLRDVRRIQAKRRWVRVPPVGGDDQQPTAAGGDSYGRMVEMGHATDKHVLVRAHIDAHTRSILAPRLVCRQERVCVWARRRGTGWSVDMWRLRRRRTRECRVCSRRLGQDGGVERASGDEVGAFPR